MKHDWDSEGVNRKCLRCGLVQRRKARVKRGHTTFGSALEWSRDAVNWNDKQGPCGVATSKEIEA